MVRAFGLDPETAIAGREGASARFETISLNDNSQALV
jgi:hypothetical protein